MTEREEYIRWHALRSFFTSLDQWRRDCVWVGLEQPMEQEEYERLLQGTAADCYLPLWASACLTGEDILLNATTLEVICFYKKYGYQWVDMDGNPPDYIGQQCRFMEYLCACQMTEAAEEFRNRFLLGTARCLCRCALTQPLSPAAEAVFRLLERAAAGEEDTIREGEPDFDSAQWRRGPELPVEPRRVTSHASFCDCGNKCKMLAVVQEGCVLSILPDRDFQGKRFSGCPRGLSYRQTFLSSRRLRYPMVRTGARGDGTFRRISWEEAEERVARSIRQSREQYGAGARYVMAAAGVCALVRPDRFMKHLLSYDGGYLDFYNFYSAACAEKILPYVYGTVFCGSPEKQMLESKLLLLWGHNPLDTHWGDGHTEYFVQARERGCRVIVIDPRCSDTALLCADQWIPIRPSTDGALADAMAYVIWSRGLQDQAFMDKFCLGFDEAHMPEGVPAGKSVHSYLFGKMEGVVKTPEWAEEITGIPASTIVELAEAYAKAKPACLLPGLGLQRTLNGEQTCRSLAMLACLTGNIGVAGGSAGAITYLKESPTGPWFAPAPNPYPARIPSFLWTRTIEQPEAMTAEDGLEGTERLETGIKLLFCLASGMLVNQHSDVNHTVAVLRRADALETLVLSDLFMTPGARFADLLLPGVSFFETENVVGSWSSSDYALYNQQAIAPLFGCRLEYEWIDGAARRLGLTGAFRQGHTDSASWMEDLYNRHRADQEPELPPFAQFREAGGFVFPAREYPPAFQKNIREGVPFQTPSGKIEIFSKRLFDGGVLPGIPCYTPCEEGWEASQRGAYPLQLIGYHSKRRCHSIGDPNRQLEALDPQTLWMHPEDAADRGIENGQLVEIFNRRGTVCIPVRVTDRIAVGTVAMSEGAWYTPDGEGRDRRGCINVLTMSHRTTPLAHGNPQHTNLVQVRKFQAIRP